VLYGYSRHVLPPPADWGPDEHVTGYWFLDPEETWQPPADLAAFLAAGPPPVYIGFGSMGSRNPAASAQLALGALAASGQRGILASGWGGLRETDLPESVFMVRAVPHSWLFPQLAAVVHHGGAGTTAAGLRAGVPSLIVPFFGDQPFWGRRVAALGVGPDPLPRKRLSEDTLASAIRQAVGDAGMKVQAAAMAEKIRAEDGVVKAIDLVLRYAATGR
jgi:sterol 3beta-glucosyltransferase